MTEPPPSGPSHWGQPYWGLPRSGPPPSAPPRPASLRLALPSLAPPPSALGPGTWVYGANMALGRRVLRSNPRVNVFHRGFVACDRYTNGEAAAQALRCPVLLVLGSLDQMTQARGANTLIEAARATGQRVEVRALPVGHHQMNETPEQTLFAIRDFLRT